MIAEPEVDVDDFVTLSKTDFEIITHALELSEDTLTIWRPWRASTRVVRNHTVKFCQNARNRLASALARGICEQGPAKAPEVA